MRLALTLALIAVPALATAASEDRYGPATPGVANAAVQLASAPAPYAGRFLAWPSKVAAPAAPPAVVTAPPVEHAPPPAAPLPTSLYAPRPAPPAPAVAVAIAQPAARPASQAGWVKSRFYSLHREYGDAPDAIPVPVDRPPVLIGPGPSAGSLGADADDSDARPVKPSDDDGIY